MDEWRVGLMVKEEWEGQGKGSGRMDRWERLSGWLYIHGHN